ncbi:MAG: TraR/DksA family transcriptional regulator [Alphaproteobacteria bacterium]|nr:TraR/DksA family transcriptional regulator [Alphaproteobacteria bacterium]
MPDADSVRAKLEQELREVTGRHARIDAHLHNADREVPQDSADRAQLMEHDEVLEALDDVERARIADLRAALRRMDAGTWGVCVRCGGAISERRLIALPTATQCIRCAEVVV